MNGKVALVISYAVFTLGLLNFATFLFEYGYFGGSASNGKAEGGKFFLRRKSPHEELRYVEVSESVFRYSAWHESTIEVGTLLAVAAGANVHRIRRRSVA